MEKDTLYKFFDGKASQEEKKAVRAWLEATPQNEKRLFREREFFDAMILSGKTRTATSKKKSRPFYLAIMQEAMKVVAIFAIVITCGVYFYQSEIRKINQSISTITVPAGQRVNLALSDGTSVWLNARSKMSYPAAFTGDKREITLDGEAYFEVSHNTEKPFVVQTSKCNVEVLGTKFNVEAYSDSEDFNAALMEGSVKVINNKNPSGTVLLSPNYMASLKNGKLSASPISDFDIFRWKEGLICFRNMNFEQLMLRFEKCYGIRIVVENKNLIKYVCSGKFRISDGIDNALRILQKDAKYSFERNKDESVIYIK